MSIQTNVDLGFPLRLYSRDCEPKPKKSINYNSKIEFLEEVENAVGEEVWTYIRDSSLGVITQFVGNKFTWSSKIFEDITTLNCASFPESENDVESKAHKKLWKKLKVRRKSPCKKELKAALEDVSSWSREDKIRFTYLSILATFIIGQDDKKELPFEYARMVFDLPKFEKYPWGREAFKRLIESVKRVDLEANSYTLDGFVQTLQIWAYNVVPSLGAKIGRPSNVDGPPILKFKGLKGLNKIDIHVVSVADKKNIKSIVINHLTPVVWADRVVDDKIDALLKAMCKDGGLGLVNWVEHGSNNIKKEKNVTADVGGEDEEGKEESDGKRKRRLEVMTTGKKKMKAPYSTTSCDHAEALHLRMELEQQAKKLETMEAQLEYMGKQLKSFEAMHSKIEFLEREVMLLREKFTTHDNSLNVQSFEAMQSKFEQLEKEVMVLREKPKSKETFIIPQLKDEDMPFDDLFANINAVRDQMGESDGESTVDARYPTVKIPDAQPQKSSPIKIIQPTASVAEKFMQKKIGQTLKIMGVDNQTKIARQKSTRVIKPGPALQTPFRNTLSIVGNNKQVIQSNMMLRHGYDPFAPVDV
ncbi:uncharacterized protein LOC18015316 [Eutrema salsugineum]|uniref:uncharacterized protein LOC18015316 n=1 Tax=Eutrema salsugineum TaxID=72664 RepID=UPI000CECEF0C|nr:uncharacterized protein LOC18015316 [Eutrema salsugineum]